MAVPGDRNGRGETVHKAVLWKMGAEVSADVWEVGGQTAEEENICPRCQSAVVKETFNICVDKFL